MDEGNNLSILQDAIGLQLPECDEVIMLNKAIDVQCNTAKPLDAIAVSVSSPGRLTVRDGEHYVYHQQRVVDHATVTIAGALGTHLFELSDDEGRLLGACRVTVHARTMIEDASGRWRRLLALLYWGLRHDKDAHSVVRVNGRAYRTFSFCVPRDHVLVLKGEQYFSIDLKDGVDLCAVTQGDDGMIYELFMPHDPRQLQSLDRFRDPRFFKLLEDGTTAVQRVPVEADCEFFFVLMLYRTWMATGDTSWMATHLAAAERALAYTRNDAVRWSALYDLPRRVLTLDMWDFAGLDDEAKTGDRMELQAEKMQFGVMHGDATGYAAACRALADMLDAAGRDGAARWREMGEQVYARIVQVAWQGEYFGHFQYEHPETRPDFGAGVDPSTQLSLSNALALNRGIPHEHAINIIRRYQALRQELPADCPAEFVTMWPFFEKGWHALPGRYVNGGVMGFVAGELAQGALEHGEEAYGVDLLQRVHAMLDRDGGTFPYYWFGRGTLEDPGQVTPLDLRPYCNCGFTGEDSHGVPGWTGQGTANDLSPIPVGRMTAHGIALEVIDPLTNGGRACVLLDGGARGFAEITIPIQVTAPALYLHHTFSARSGTGFVGWVTIRYADGSAHRRYVNVNKELGGWWDPIDIFPPGHAHSSARGYEARVAWRGRNETTWVGSYIWGWDHPRPEQHIDSLTFTHSGLPGDWFLLGITLGSNAKWLGDDQPHPNVIANWHSAACLAALLEGLGGITPTAPVMRQVALRPRWAASGETDITCCAHFPESGGYCAYHYRYSDDCLTLQVASSADELAPQVLLPPNRAATRVTIDGIEVAYHMRVVEQSSYVCAQFVGRGAKTLCIWTAAAG